MKEDKVRQVVVVTGGGRGIGFTIAEIFARNGALAVIADIDAGRAKRSADALQKDGYESLFFSVDLKQPEAPQRMISDIWKEIGPIAVLVNNARAGERVSVLEETVENWQETMAVTLQASFFAAQEVIRLVDERGAAIVNIGSILGSLVSIESPSYHAAKSALFNITRYLAVVGGPYNVRVNMVSPGFIVQDEHLKRFYSKPNKKYRTKAESVHPLKHIGTSRDVAKAVQFLASSAAEFITGQELVVDGGLTLQEQSSLNFRDGLTK